MLFIQTRPPYLKLRDALVLSLILRRHNVGRPTSRRYIERRTGIDRTRTLPKTLARLAAAGLVGERPGSRLLDPLPPQGEAMGWFVWKKGTDDRPWPKRLAHFPVLLRSPACPLSLEQNVVYWKLRDLERQGRTRQTVLGLADRLLGVSRPTVTNALHRLRDLGLLDYFQDGSRVVFATRLPDAARPWFATGEPKPKPRTKPVSPPAAVAATEPASPLVAQLVAAGLDRKRADELYGWHLDVDLMVTHDWLTRTANAAVREHRANGTAPPDRWGPLFYWKVRRAVERRRPRVEAAACQRRDELVAADALLGNARRAGYRCVSQFRACCDGRLPFAVPGVDRQYSPELRAVQALVRPMEVAEYVGRLACPGCGEPDLADHWFEAAQGTNRYLLFPPQPDA